MKKAFIALAVVLIAVTGITAVILAAAGIKEVATELKQTFSSYDENERMLEITEDEAKKIALEKAGVREADVRFFRIEFDVDKVELHYNIEFEADGYEYDIEVSAENGSILSFDKEKEDIFD